MMRLTPFAFHAPPSLAEATELLARNDGDVRILAGGTDLVVGMKQSVARPKHLVWLGRVRELGSLSVSPEGGLRIGAMCTLGDLERNGSIQRLHPVLAEVLRSIASPQIRNRATIGGNLCLDTRCFYYDQSEFWRGSLGYCLKHGDGLCHAAPGLKSCSATLSSDLAPFLMAAGASVRIAGPAGTRTIGLEGLYVDDGMAPLALGRGELLAEITLPPPEGPVAFKKLRRRQSIDYPLVNVGAMAVFGADGVVNKCRIVVGAVGSRPVELHASQEILTGGRLTLEQIERASDAAAGQVKPLPNALEPVLYRKSMVRRLVTEALNELGTPMKRPFVPMP